MKASELIQDFQRLIAEYGDLDVVNESDEGVAISYSAEEGMEPAFVIY